MQKKFLDSCKDDYETCYECKITRLNARALTGGLLEPASLKEVTMSPRSTPTPPQQASSRHDVYFTFQFCCSLNLGTDTNHGRTPWCELSAARLRT